jgi:hypothetical protein
LTMRGNECSINSQLTYDFASLTDAHDGAIEDIAFDPHHCRIGAVGKGGLSIWDINAHGQ